QELERRRTRQSALGTRGGQTHNTSRRPRADGVQLPGMRDPARTGSPAPGQPTTSQRRTRPSIAKRHTLQSKSFRSTETNHENDKYRMLGVAGSRDEPLR